MIVAMACQRGEIVARLAVACRDKGNSLIKEADRHGGDSHRATLS